MNRSREGVFHIHGEPESPKVAVRMNRNRQMTGALLKIYDEPKSLVAEADLPPAVELGEGTEPDLHEVLADARWQEDVLASRLPPR